MVVGHDGKIVAVGSNDDMKEYLDGDEEKYDDILDASGKSIIPGSSCLITLLVRSTLNGLSALVIRNSVVMNIYC